MNIAISDQLEEVMANVRKASFAVMKAEESTGAEFKQADIADYIHGVHNARTEAVEMYLYNCEEITTRLEIGSDYLERIADSLKTLQTLIEESEGK